MPLKITHNSKIYFPSFMDSRLEVKPKQIKGKGHKLSEKMGARTRTRTRQNVNLCYLVWPKVTTIIAHKLWEFAIKFLDLTLPMSCTNESKDMVTTCMQLGFVLEHTTWVSTLGIF